MDDHPTRENSPYRTTNQSYESVCQQADKITRGERAMEYGHPRESFAVVAELWSSFLGVELDAEKVMACMTLLKLARLKYKPGHRDSIRDIAGYANCMGMNLDA